MRFMQGNLIDGLINNDKLLRFIDVIVIVWIVLDIIVLTSMYFINLGQHLHHDSYF